MARITVTIEAMDADDLQTTIEFLARPKWGDKVVVTSSVREPLVVDEAAFLGEDEQVDAGAREDAEPEERQAAGTRFRRTKDEQERGLTVEQAKAERAAKAGGGSPVALQLAASLEQPATPASSETAAPGSGGASDEIDPFADPGTASLLTSDASTETTAQTEDGPTADDVKKAMAAFLGRDGSNGNKLLAVCEQFTTVEGDKCARASQLQPKDYAAFIAALAA